MWPDAGRRQNISINLSSVFGDGSARGGSNSDKSPRRVSSTPDSLMQPASARKMNPLWVLNQKAKMVEEEKDKREREERRKREREVLPVGEDVPEKQRQRNRVINEIVNTERDYVQDLKIMLTLFRFDFLLCLSCVSCVSCACGCAENSHACRCTQQDAAGRRGHSHQRGVEHDLLEPEHAPACQLRAV
jgi:hypothetical protein